MYKTVILFMYMNHRSLNRSLGVYFLQEVFRYMYRHVFRMGVSSIQVLILLTGQHVHVVYCHIQWPCKQQWITSTAAWSGFITFKLGLTILKRSSWMTVRTLTSLTDMLVQWWKVEKSWVTYTCTVYIRVSSRHLLSGTAPFGFKVKLWMAFARFSTLV